MKNEDIIRLSVEQFNAARESDQDERREIENDIRFAINDEGCQWDPSARAARENDSPPRPCLVINKIPEKIDQAEGEFRQLKPSVKVRAVDSLADPKIAEILGGLINHIQYDSTARSAYNHSHTSTLYGGRGAWRIDIEEDEDDPFVRCIKINRIPNVLAVYWDQDSKKEDKSDARRFWVTEEISELLYKNRYQDHEIGRWDADDLTMQGWRTDKTVRVAEYWWKEKEDREFNKVERTINGITSTVVIPTDKLDKMPDRDSIIVVDTKIAKVDKVRWGIMNHREFIDGPHDDWPSKYIPIVVETGKEVNVRGKFKNRGMVRYAKGPQEMYNYFSTSATETYALAPKAPYLATSKMIGPYQAQWDSAAVKNYMYLLYNPDPSVPGSKPQREVPPQLSSAIANELGRMDHDIMAAMGRYQASLGDQGQEKSGRAITARQRQGSIGGYTFTDKFGGALNYSTKILIDLCPSVYDTERIVRIIGPDEKEMSVPINAVPDGQAMRDVGEVPDNLVSHRPEISAYVNDLSVGRYDVVATVGPSYTTQRQEASAMILDLIQSVPKIGIATADILIKNLDIPEADEVIKRVRKLIPVEIRGLEPGEQPPPPPPPDPEILVEMRKLIIDMRAEDRKEFEAQVKAITQLAEAESKERGQQLQEYTETMNQIRADVQVMSQMQQGPGTGIGTDGPSPGGVR
jgi:hypothetical protein